MKEALYFVAGAGVASVITYFCTKSYYAKKADAEIAAVREYYRSKDGETVEVKDSTEENEKLKPEMDSIIKNYSAVSTQEPEKEEPKITPGNEPYVITEEKYDEIFDGIGQEGDEYEDYEALTSYRYFGNGVLVNSKDQVVDMPTIAKFIGLGNLRKLAMQDEDVIYICNDVYKCAYEILREDEDYVDPHAEG